MCSKSKCHKEDKSLWLAVIPAVAVVVAALFSACGVVIAALISNAPTSRAIPTAPVGRSSASSISPASPSLGRGRLAAPLSAPFARPARVRFSNDADGPGPLGLARAGVPPARPLLSHLHLTIQV